MINSLKSDFYKAFKSKNFYIALLVLLGFGLLIVALSYASGEYIYGKAFFLEGMSHNLTFVFSAIFISIFICSDFSSGMMRNYVSGNISRSKVFFSKAIVCLAVSVIFLVFSTLIFGLLGVMFFGYGMPFTGTEFLEIFVKLLLEILVLAAYVSIFLFIAISLRATGGVVSLNILIIFIVPLILSIFVAALPSLANIVDYWLGQNVAYAAYAGYPGELGKYILTIILVPIFYIAVTFIPAYGIFRFKDVR